MAKTALVALFTASLIAANLLGSKLVSVLGVTVSVGLFVFPFTFLSLDALTEVYGKKSAERAVQAGILMQVYVLAFVYFGKILPPAPGRDLHGAYETMFALTPRMVLASIVAYTTSQYLDVALFARLKKVPRLPLLLRTNVTSWAAQFVDTAVFSGIFLGPTLGLDEWWKSFLFAYACKMTVATFDSPFVNTAVWLIRKGGRRELEVRAVRTDMFRSDLLPFLARHLRGRLQEGDVVAITSKIVSLAEGRTVPREGQAKNELVRKEADRYLGEGGYGIELTIKHGLLIPSAGIDESNSEQDSYILYPEHPYESAAVIGRFLRKELGIEKLGVILTDSHTMPLRLGVTGISLAHWGIRATRSLVGAPDLFGRELKFTSVDVVDSLASSAVFVMGEADDRCPLAIVRGAAIEFTDSSSQAEIAIEPEKDLYWPLLRKN